MKPSFSFTSNNAAPGDQSGMATWTYTVRRRREDVDIIVRQPFSTFAAAHAINELIIVAWEDGLQEGAKRVCRTVDAALLVHR